MLYLARTSKYKVIWKAAVAFCLHFLLIRVWVYAQIHTGFPDITYKGYLIVLGGVFAVYYWRLADNGWVSVPIYFTQIGLIWALYYLLTKNPSAFWFFLVYNRFADLCAFYLIGCSLYRIRALRKRRSQSMIRDKGTDALQPDARLSVQ